MKQNIRYILTVICLSLFYTNIAVSQLAMGQWRNHLPYHRATTVAVSPQKVYCATDVSMFSYDKDDHSLERLSKVNGFSDIGVSALMYSDDYKMLIVGYQNGNIDLMNRGEIINLADIKRKQFSGSKRINSIMLLNSFAYLSCNFGIVVLNLEKMEIVDTYVLTSNGGALQINATTFDGTKLWAATNQGIYNIAIDSPNLLDFNNWSFISDIPESLAEFTDIQWFNNKIYTIYQIEETKIINKLYEFDGASWKHILQDYVNIKALDTNGEQLILSNIDYMDVLNKDLSLESHVFGYNTPKNPAPRMAVFDTDNSTIWIADGANGLVKNKGTWSSEVYYPDGPEYANAVAISIEDEHINIVSGGRWSKRGGYHFYNNNWSSYNDLTVEGMDNFVEILAVKTDPQNPSRVFLGSNGNGLIEMIDGKVVNRYDDKNSLLDGLVVDPGAPCRISGMDYDSEGNLWVAIQQGVEHPVMMLNNKGEWSNFDDLHIKTFVGDGRIEDLYVTSTNQKWVIPRGKNLVVIGDAAAGEIRNISISNKEGETQTSNIYAVIEDHEGYIWVGTDKGVFVFYSPEDAFSEKSLYASQPSVDRNDGFQHDLLQEERVTAIAVDGANRKWFGTRTNGIYLISEDGTQELRHFDFENSPLPSNSILSIDINHKNGEVFIATDKGLISYKSEATTGNLFFEDVYVYPNPVRPGYEGMITITGLVENANVKITDITGNLVSESTAFGGQAVWNGKTISGRKVQTGVYLIYCTNEDGSETYVTKVLFIN